MNNEKIKAELCRICSKEIIQSNSKTEQIVEILKILKISFGPTSLVCNTCVDILDKACKFKAILNSEHFLLPFADRLCLDDIAVCRFCSNIVQTDHPLSEIPNKISTIENFSAIFKKYFSESDLDITNSIVCQMCHKYFREFVDLMTIYSDFDCVPIELSTRHKLHVEFDNKSVEQMMIYSQEYQSSGTEETRAANKNTYESVSVEICSDNSKNINSSDLLKIYAPQFIFAEKETVSLNQNCTDSVFVENCDNKISKTMDDKFMDQENVYLTQNSAEKYITAVESENSSDCILETGDSSESVPYEESSHIKENDDNKSENSLHIADLDCEMAETLLNDRAELECLTSSIKTNATILLTNMTDNSCNTTIKNNFKLKWYPCKICDYKTKIRAHVARHMLIHGTSSDVVMYKCTECSYESKLKWNVNKHYALLHKDPSEMEIFECPICLRVLKHSKDLYAHIKKCHNDQSNTNTYKCQLCGYETDLGEHLTRHLMAHRKLSDIKMHKCPECPYETKFKWNLQKHLIKHKDRSEIEWLKCNQCPYVAKHKIALQKHFITHKKSWETQMYSCETCQYRSKFKKNFNRHMELVHLNPKKAKSYKCDDCSFETKWKAELKKHSLLHENSLKVVVHQCDKCTYTTKRKRCLERHLMKHQDPNELDSYKCKEEDCRFETKRKKNFLQHMLIHHTDTSEVTMYKCDRCEYQAKIKTYLMRHIKSKHM